MEFEKKKLILPILGILILTSFLAGFYNYRANQYGEKQAADRGIADFNSMAVRLEHDYFNESFSRTEYDRANQFYPANQADIAMTKDPLYLPLMVGSYAYRSNLFPLMPSSSETLRARSFGLFRSNSLLFPASSGYVLSEDIFYSKMEWNTKKYRLQKLDRRVNNSNNWTLTELREEIDSIRNSDTTKEEMLSYIESIDSRNERTPARKEKVKQLIKNNDVKEVNIWHFIPAFIATFTVYYLISGILVLGVRNIRARLKNNSSQIKNTNSNIKS
ncbi:MAG: hypothetical protein V5A72_00745 [Candidatus Nanohaloarchaea archaeon]